MKASTPVLSVLASLAILASGSATAINVDVTATKGITIGGAIGGAGGKFVPWGGSVVINEKDGIAGASGNGTCAFNVNYDMQNNGNAGTDVFKNQIIAKGKIVAINSMLTLTAGQSRQISTQPYLPIGAFELNLKLDAENNLSESNENNNIVTIKVVLDGVCGAKPVTPPPPPPPPPPKADLASVRGIGIGGAVGGAGSHTTPWGTTLTLHAADAFLTSNGKCAFNIIYDMANIGAAASGSFVNQLLGGTTVISQQSGLSLDKGKTSMIMTQAYLFPGRNELRLLIDSSHNVNESNEANNEMSLIVNVDATCKPALATPPVVTAPVVKPPVTTTVVTPPVVKPPVTTTVVTSPVTTPIKK